MADWILLTVENSLAVWIPQEGDQMIYEIAPEDALKRGDNVYLWSNPHNSFFGYGEVAETPMPIKVQRQMGSGNEEIRRYSVMVNRTKEFRPPVTEWLLSHNREVKKLIPKGFDDLYALPLRPGQAAYLNDFIRELNLDAPKGSAPISWLAQEDAPQIDLAAQIIVVGDKTNEGRLVEGVKIAWYEMIRYFGEHPEELYNIDPRKFEELIAGGYEREGYKVELTPASNDRGRDVVATRRDGIGWIRIFDQVKRYKIHRPVSADQVRSLVGVLDLEGNVSKGVITTTGVFAPTLLDDPKIAALIPHRLELRPREVLLNWLNRLKGK